VPPGATIRTLSYNMRYLVHLLMTILFLAIGQLMLAAAEVEESVADVGVTKPARCTVRQEPNGWWLVSPSGKPFFSLGICEFNQGTDRQSYDLAKPSYAGWQHYDSSEAWARDNLQRLKSWGFTTVGGWSDYKSVDKANVSDVWITPVLSLGARSGAPWFDMWDEKVVAKIDQLAKDTIGPFRGNPRVIGYFSDNELGWWNAALWKLTLEQPAASGQRQHLVRVVREAYRDDWNALVSDFEPGNTANWAELERSGMLWLRPGGNGILAMRRFLGVVAERYYQLMGDAIRKHDPGALYLGDRYQSFYYPEVALAAKTRVDIVSTNLNAHWNDGTFLRSFHDTLHQLTGKPLIISEFYMAAKENGSGNNNRSGIFPAVETQRERGEALATTLRELLRLPYVVGADWFQYYDEPPSGRPKDGEDYNFGLIDIHNHPYSDVTAAFASADIQSQKSQKPNRQPDATTGVPPAPSDPLGNFRPMTALKSWDRRRGLVPPQSKYPLGDMYVCWSPEAIYLATYVIDMAETDYYNGGDIPDIDRALWTLRLNEETSISVRVGAGKDPVVDRPDVRVESLSGTYQHVRCITAVELPAKLFGKERFSAGNRISFSSTFDSLARAHHIEWKGDFELSQ
jgi:hypothetical protein